MGKGFVILLCFLLSYLNFSIIKNLYQNTKEIQLENVAMIPPPLHLGKKLPRKYKNMVSSFSVKKKRKKKIKKNPQNQTKNDSVKFWYFEEIPQIQSYTF